MGSGKYMDGCGNFMKYSLFFVNFAIFVGGIIVVILGVWTVVDKSFANELLGTNLYSGAVYVLIATGILVTIVSCFGCFGAAQEVRCMLVMYFLVIFMIFVTMLVGGILGLVFKGKVETTLRNGMIGSMRSYNYSKSVTDAWDETQFRLKCCGINSPLDWITLPARIPDSCCEPIRGRPQRCHLLYEQHASNVYSRGCLNVTKQYVKEHANVIGIVGIVVACIMILAMIFSCALFNTID